MDPVAGVRSGRFVDLLEPHSFRLTILSALTEFHCTDDKAVAQRIFEKGLDSFSDEIEYVIRYLGFLISINDGNSALLLLLR